MKASFFMILLISATLFLSQTGVNAQCTDKFGCHKGKCWHGCSFLWGNINGIEWCYSHNRNGAINCNNNEGCREFRCSVCHGGCGI